MLNGSVCDNITLLPLMYGVCGIRVFLCDVCSLCCVPHLTRSAGFPGSGGGNTGTMTALSTECGEPENRSARGNCASPLMVCGAGPYEEGSEGQDREALGKQHRDRVRTHGTGKRRARGEGLIERRREKELM